MPGGSVQLYSLNLFRGLAIVLVVFSHADELGVLHVNTFPEIVIWNLLSGATTMFVFISGFLFDHVFLKKFDFASFMKKKFVNLFIPYLMLTFVALGVGCALIPPDYFDGHMSEVVMGAYMLASGHATLAYWFIPFAITLFALAPLHAKFATLRLRTQLVIVGACLLVALLVHRPPLNLGPIQNLVYYTPTYLIGMMCSQHRAVAYPLLSRLTWPLLGAVIGLATLQAVLGVAGNYGKEMFVFGGIDLMLLQKLCLCLFLLTFLTRFESKRSPTIDLLAETSFAIFFLHPIVMELMLQTPLLAPALVHESWPQFAILATFCLFASAGSHGLRSGRSVSGAAF